MKTVTAYTTSHAYEIPADCVADIARTGPNEAAVEAWVPRIDWAEWDADQIRDELRDAGAWSEEELADDLDTSEADAAALLHISGHELSLSDPLEGGRPDGHREVGDVLEQVLMPKADEALVHRAVRSELRRAIAGLDPKEREVMRLRFGLDGGEALGGDEVAPRVHVAAALECPSAGAHPLPLGDRC